MSAEILKATDMIKDTKHAYSIWSAQFSYMIRNLDENFTRRVPILFSGDDKYLQDRYHPLPKERYTKMVK